MEPGVLAVELLAIIALALLNGVLAMSEMAMVSAKKPRLQQAATDGSSGARAALKLLEDPSRFLAAIQIGITLIGVFAGAFGGANIAEGLAAYLSQYPAIAPHSEGISLGLVVCLVTLLSLILGELVPKRLALGHSEGIAILMAKPITGLSFIARPAVRFLSLATEGILKLFRYKQKEEAPVTEDEVRIMVEQGTQFGVFEEEEEKIIKRTLLLGDQYVREVMTQRWQLVGLDINDSVDKNYEIIRGCGHSYFPVFRDQIDRVVGVLSIKKVFAAMSLGQSLDLSLLIEEPLFVSESMPALKLLNLFRASGKHFAVVIDEYGGLSDVVTVIDLLESIVGGMPDAEQQESEGVVTREDGSYLVDGMFTLKQLPEAIPGMSEAQFEKDKSYQTLGGFIMGELGHIPRTGELLTWKGWSFEVIDMDGNRVDKVLIKTLS